MRGTRAAIRGEGSAFFAYFLAAQDCQPTLTTKLTFVSHLVFSSVFWSIKLEHMYAILLAMAQSIIDPEATTESREGHVTVAEAADRGSKTPPEQQEPTQRLSWWWAFLGWSKAVPLVFYVLLGICNAQRIPSSGLPTRAAARGKPSEA